MSKVDHIKSLRLKNFKCFEDFMMDNIGQFNLIVGANNSGKTSLLEGLLLMQGDGDRYLYHALRKRYGVNSSEVGSAEFDFIQLFKPRDKGSEPIELLIEYNFGFPKRWRLDSMSLKEVKEDGRANNALVRTYSSHDIAEMKSDLRLLVSGHSNSAIQNKVGPDEWAVGVSRLKEQEFELRKDDFLPFVSASDLHGIDMVDMYTASIQRDKARKKALVDAMRMIIPELEDIEPTPAIVPWGSVIGLWLSSQDRIVPLADYGDGAVRIFRLALTMIHLHSGLHSRTLLIDEVDYGIHRGKLPEFWKQLIEIAQRLEIQLFMTTHNEECVRAFWEAFESEELKSRWGVERDEVARHFILERDKNNIPRSYSVPLSHLGHALDAGNDIMGFA